MCIRDSCTEMIVGGRGLPLDQMRRELAPYGDCLMVVGNDETAKVHIHSNHPGLVLECCLKYGALNNVQISNMEEQHRELNSPSGPEKPLGIVSVGQGEGIINIMESLGADSVIPGGQTMNPSTEVILEAINRVSADRVIVLPNNSNVVMAVEQAKKISGKEVEMVKTLNIPQGLAAMLVHNPYGDIGDIACKMAAAAESIKCGEVTRAVRDTQMDGLNISAGDYIAVVEDRILASGTQLHPVVSGLVKAITAEDAEIVTLYYGAGISGSEAESLAEGLGKEFGELEIELHYGGQPHYQFIISAE
jgi:DAK2 domain fusion protein YloV